MPSRKNLLNFRDYVAIHATDWYKFINRPRGREAPNADLRFSNTNSAQQSNFRLNFRPLRGQQQPQHNARSAYAWGHLGAAEVRVEPERGENERIPDAPVSKQMFTCAHPLSMCGLRHFPELFRPSLPAIALQRIKPGSFSIRGHRPAREIKWIALEPDYNPVMKDELGRVPAQLGAVQNEDRMWDVNAFYRSHILVKNPSKVINKHHPVPKIH
ncbi:hypothetical protein BYT27DRAFT_7341593 [Phlegmacium glaucopus]|nr:hypothetical protein BYT27DRAFT_7341593 [Phlegmacium glaucopus]